MNNDIIRISSYGIVLVTMTFLGLAAGVYLKDIIGLQPYTQLFCVLVGIGLGFRPFIKEVRANN